ncbi:hypothetical protein JCM10213_008910 [Rhodosporidiobolus nylandii]
MSAALPSLSHLQWRAPEFLLAVGGQLTNPSLALEYFSLSPFFDKASSNAQLRMQMMFSRGGMDGVDEEAELRRFTGIEYVVAHASPPNLFILHKRERTSPADAVVLGAFYILNGNVYQAPTLFEVLNERVLTSIHAISTSLSSLTALKPAWTPETLYHWNIKPPPASTALPSAEAAAAAGSEDVAGGEKREREEVEGEEGAAEKREKLDEENEERPAEAFNPLLFRALQRVASRLEPPPGMA